MTMSLIETVEVGAGGAASIEFTSIPQNGTDLVILTSIRDTAVASFWPLYVRINGSSLSSLSLVKSGSSVISTTNPNSTALSVNSASSGANTFNNGYIYIPNYTNANPVTVAADNVSTNTSSTVSILGFDVFGGVSGPVTSLTLITANNFVQYSSASLYKITKGSDGSTVVS